MLRGDEVDFVEDQDERFLEDADDVMVKRRRKVEKRVAGICKDDDDVTDFRDSPQLSPDLCEPFEKKGR